MRTSTLLLLLLLAIVFSEMFDDTQKRWSDDHTRSDISLVAVITVGTMGPATWRQMTR
jgi:hypothetical protein